MAKVRVPIYGTPAKTVSVDPAATPGAVFGENLFWPDGTLVKQADFAPVPSDPLDPSVTLWRLILEIPQNIRELAKLNGVGFSWRNADGTWRLRQVGRQIVPFAFGDASSVIYTPSATSVATLCRIEIDVPFNGTGAQLSVGTAGSPELLMPVSGNAPGIAAGYETTPDAELAAGEGVQLTIVPGAGASAGSGRIILDSIPVEGI